jgi:hypothetical protein
MHAVWVHGNSVRAQWVGDPPLGQVTAQRSGGGVGGVPWSEFVGLPTGPGQTFRCRDSGGGERGSRAVHPRLSTFFHFSIPTPVMLSGDRLSLLRVFVLRRATGPAFLLQVNVFDGPTVIPVATPVAEGPHRDGTGGLADLVPGVTQFDLKPPHQVLWGIGVSVGFGFEADLDLTFTAAGADFEYIK